MTAYAPRAAMRPSRARREFQSSTDSGEGMKVKGLGRVSEDLKSSYYTFNDFRECTYSFFFFSCCFFLEQWWMMKVGFIRTKSDCN